MDHISKALEKAKGEQPSVRAWVRPSRNGAATVSPLPNQPNQQVSLSREHLRANHVLCGTDEEDPIIADKYRLLRTRTIQIMRPQGWSVLGITSPGPQAGKTLTAMNLAISLARDGTDNVVLVDADLRKPSIAEDLGIEPEYGLIDYLAFGTPLEDVLVQPDIDNLVLLPGRHTESRDRVPELLHSKRMVSLMKTLREGSDRMVIVDLPPVLVGDDVIATAPRLDALLIVVEDAQTEVEELQKTSELLADFNVLGAVLNKSTEQTKGAEGYSYYTVQTERS